MTVPAPPSPVRRPLSPVERWYWICDQLSPLNVISRVTVRGELPPELLRRALDVMQARHPLLRVAVVTDADGAAPHWVPTRRPIPLRYVVAEEPSARDWWIREVNDVELPVSVDWHSGPMIRALAIRRRVDEHDLVVTVPHCIADGTTVLSLAREWLELADLTASGADLPAPERVLPPPDQMLPPQYSRAAGAARLADQLVRDEQIMSRLHPARFEPDRRVPMDQRRTRLVHRSLEGGQLAALVDACRQEDTTVHSALTAAMALAAACDAGHPRPAHFAIGSPIDFRGELMPPVSPHEVGTYVATVPSVVDCNPHAPFWAVARAVNADLAERKRLGQHFCLVNLVVDQCPNTVGDSLPFMEFMEAKGPINLCISNLGRYEFPDTIGSWQLSESQFLTGISVNGYFVATINTSHGRLSWNFTYIVDAVSDKRAHRLADDCLRTLLDQVGGDHTCSAAPRHPSTQSASRQYK